MQNKMPNMKKDFKQGDRVVLTKYADTAGIHKGVPRPVKGTVHKYPCHKAGMIKVMRDGMITPEYYHESFWEKPTTLPPPELPRPEPKRTHPRVAQQKKPRKGVTIEHEPRK